MQTEVERAQEFIRTLNQSMIEGETHVIFLSPRYVTRILTVERNVDFSVLPEIEEHVAKSTLPTYWKDTFILPHLRDAKNKHIPEDRRNIHFDVMGSYIWQACKLGADTSSIPLGRVMSLYAKAGGI